MFSNFQSCSEWVEMETQVPPILLSSSHPFLAVELCFSTKGKGWGELFCPSPRRPSATSGASFVITEKGTLDF